MSPFEHGEVFVLDDGGEVRSAATFACTMPSICTIISVLTIVPLICRWT